MRRSRDEEYLLHLFHHASNMLRRGSPHGGHGCRNRGGSHHGQGRVLHILQQHKEMSQRDLQDILQVRAASLSEILHKLEANKWIERERDPEDRRVARIRLTPEGKQMMQNLHASHHDSASTFFAKLTAQERTSLQHILEKLLSSNQ